MFWLLMLYRCFKIHSCILPSLAVLFLLVNAPHSLSGKEAERNLELYIEAPPYMGHVFSIVVIVSSPTEATPVLVPLKLLERLLSSSADRSLCSSFKY